MSKRNTHPLSKKHFNTVIRRSDDQRKKLHTRRGVTWNLRGRKMIPLGHASMMLMDGRPDVTASRGERIDLYCVTAQTRMQGGMVHYDRVRMLQDWAKNPRPGAKGQILDPREEGTPCKKGEKPNASWVRMAQELDRQMVRSLDRDWLLGYQPQMPSIWACFPCRGTIELQDTPALRRDLAEAVGVGIEYFNTITPEEFNQLAASKWPDLWVAPGVMGNETSCWLIEHKYVANLDHVDRVEDFSDLVGVHIRNPVRDVQTVKLQNPTLHVAKDMGVDMPTLLATLERGAEEADTTVLETDDAPTTFANGYDQAVDQFVKVREGVQQYLGHAAKRFSVAEIDQAIANPSEGLVVAGSSPLQHVPAMDAVRALREYLGETRPLYLDGVTDDDLLAAIDDPSAPLLASNQCRFQVLSKDPNVPDFNFGDTMGQIAAHISRDNWRLRG